MNYTPLYIKTHYSLLHSMIKIEDLIDFAIKNKLKSLTITDNNLYGTMEFYKACKKNNIKPIIGLELEFETLKFVVYAKNYEGYKNLLKLNSKIENLKIEDLINNSENLIPLIPQESVKLYDDLKKIFKDIYLESEDLYLREILYLEKSDKNYLKYLHAIKKGVSFSDITIRNDHHIEIEAYNQELNKKITEMCNLELEFNKDLLPEFPCPDNIDSFTYLKKLCKEGLKRIFGEVVLKTYIERLKYELEIINKMGFSNYFLIVNDYVDFAKKNGILVGPGRGSAAGSLVSYCLNITTVDPIKYNLLFERFLNPERISMPDIDIDFEYNRREEVINYCINKYGKSRVAPIITFGTLAAKQVIRDVSRTMDIDLKVVDKITKTLNPYNSLLENYKTNKELKALIDRSPELSNMYKIATKFEGLKRHTSIHAAGIVMSRCDLDEVIPIDDKHKDFLTTSFSMEYLEEIGLLKMDFLGLKNLNLITETLKIIPDKIDFDKIPLDDEKALNIFTEVNTIGIFQFESAGMINFLKKFRPNTFEDVFAAIALFRPGPMSNIDTYIARKHGSEKIDYLHKDLEDILKNTYGIIVYQEQIMQIANIMAGYSFGEADVLRKAMSKKKEDIMLLEKEKFINNSVKRGYELELATKVFDYIFKFAAYGFNRAHSVSYAMIAYKMAYLKANYKKEFLQTLLNLVIGSEVKTKEYLSECKKNGIKIIKPSVLRSDSKFISDKDGILFPLSIIKGVSNNTINQIKAERSNIKNIFDFIAKIYGKNCNKKTLENLIYSGALDEFNLNRRTMIENIDILTNYGEIIKDLDSEFAHKPIIKMFDEYSEKELLKLEESVMGIYLGEHPLTKIKIINNNTFQISDVDKYFDKKITLYAILDNYREILTKSNNQMAFLTISDEFAITEAVIFPTNYININLEIGKAYKIEGKVEKRYDKYQIVIDKINLI